MTTIRLRNHCASDVTMITNEFIDNYMVAANGEYVKIYLYILRLTLDSSRSWTLSTITDKLECTSKDVLRALRYWMKKGLLACEFTEDGDLSCVTFLHPESNRTEEVAFTTARAYIERDIPAAAIPAAPTASSAPVVPAASTAAAPTVSPTPVVPEISYARERNEAIVLPPERVKALKKSKEAKLILISAAGYMGHPLNQAETDTFLYFYDELHFSVDLLDYLVEYCASREARNIAYIKKVGFAWYDAGITTVEQAREESRTHAHDYYSIMRACGLGSREPSTYELKYLKKWLETDALPQELVLEAVNRTMEQIQNPRFSYTDRILESWKKEGALTMDAVRALDEKHAQQAAVRKDARPASARSTSGRGFSAGNKQGFTDYSGREIDYDTLEQQLLGY